jgi:hypothetical protein
MRPFRRRGFIRQTCVWYVRRSIRYSSKCDCASARSHTAASIVPGRITNKQLQTLGKANAKRRMMRKY